MNRTLVVAAVLLVSFLLPFTGNLAARQDKPEPEKKEKEKEKELPKYDLIYVPTPDAVIEKMFAMAKVGKEDTLFDLGCGDGRVVCQAVTKFGCKGVGIDLNPQRIKECMDTIKKFKVEDAVTNFRLEFRLGDALKVADFDRASAVFLYMLPEFMDLLEPIAEKTLKPGTRIVSHDFRWQVGDWEPEETIEFKGPERNHTLYLWTAKGEKK